MEEGDGGGGGRGEGCGGWRKVVEGVVTEEEEAILEKGVMVVLERGMLVEEVVILKEGVGVVLDEWEVMVVHEAVVKQQYPSF